MWVPTHRQLQKGGTSLGIWVLHSTGPVGPGRQSNNSPVAFKPRDSSGSQGVSHAVRHFGVIVISGVQLFSAT